MDQLMTASSAKERVGARAAQSDEPIVCLNFKVPLRFRQEFKLYALRQNLSMTELLIKIIEREFEESAACK